MEVFLQNITGVQCSYRIKRRRQLYSSHSVTMGRLYTRYLLDGPSSITIHVIQRVNKIANFQRATERGTRGKLKCHRERNDTGANCDIHARHRFPVYQSHFYELYRDMVIRNPRILFQLHK